MSNVYDQVTRQRFLTHAMVCDPQCANIVHELVNYCDHFKGKMEAAELAVNDARMALSMCGIVPIQGQFLSNAISELNGVLTARTKRLNKLEHMLGDIALMLREDMTNDQQPEHPNDICFLCGADLFNEGPHKPECKYGTR